MSRRVLPYRARAPRTAPEVTDRSRIRRRTAAVALGLALALGMGGSAGADSATPNAALHKSIDRILADKRLAGASSSVVISDAASGDVLYDRHSGKRLMPASNTKLLTSAAAMDVLGPGYRYNTDVLADGTRDGGQLDGDLYLRGTGDPTLLAKNYDALAADVAASGIKKVTGRLMADDTRFDSQRLGRSGAADDQSAYNTSQISAQTLAPHTHNDPGGVYLKITPGAEAGDKPKVKITPSNRYVDLEVTGTTVAKGGSDTLSIDREHGGNKITVSGGIPLGADAHESWTSVWEPTGYAASVFADALKEHGVQVAKETELGRVTPQDARQVAGHRSMPLAQLIVPFMKLSNNNHAEVLTKTMGDKTSGKGTWNAGLDAVGRFLKKEGVDTGTLRQVDGSGLSRMDNVPAGEFATLLHSVRSKPWFKQWYDALPIACEPDRLTGGTLRSRMCGTAAEGNAHAKTGTLTGGSGLSGYVTDSGGRQLAYSIIFNNHFDESVEDIQDAIVVALASHGDHARRAPDSGPRPSGSDPAGVECSWTKPARC